MIAPRCCFLKEIEKKAMSDDIIAAYPWTSRRNDIWRCELQKHYLLIECIACEMKCHVTEENELKD